MKILSTAESEPELEESCECKTKFSFTRSDTRNVVQRRPIVKGVSNYVGGEITEHRMVRCPSCHKDIDVTAKLGTVPATP